MKAFPVEYYGREEGMDLRDYFAAKAMQGIMSKEYYEGSYRDVAMYAYKCADEMMKARNNETN